MLLKSLKARIITASVFLVVFSLIITTFFLQQRAKTYLEHSIEKNAKDLLKATKHHVELQHKSILYHRKIMIDRRKQELKNNLTIALSFLNREHTMVINKEITRQKAQDNIIKHLKSLKYDNNIGYFWINDTTNPIPKMIMHPTMPELNNTILDNPKFYCVMNTNENLFQVFQEKCTTKGNGYVYYNWAKPILGKLSNLQPKLSYVQLFKPWNWIVGTGIYIDDIEKDIQHRIDTVIKDLNQILVKQTKGSSSYFLIFNDQKKILVHPKLNNNRKGFAPDQITSHKILEKFQQVSTEKNKSIEYLWDKPGFEGEYKFLKKAFITYYKPLKWYIVSTVYKKEYEKLVKDLDKKIILFSFSFIIITIVISLILSRSITKPLNKLTSYLTNKDKDGIPVNLPLITGSTEITLLSETINNMIFSINKSRGALKQSESKFRSLIESTNDYIWETDINGRYTYASPQIKTILGYPPSNVIGKTPFDFMPEEESQKIHYIFTKMKEKKQPLIMLENINLHKKGYQVILETNAIPILNDNDELIGYRGVDRNITTRKQAEKDLKQLRIYLSNIINSMPSILIGVDVNFKVIQWNQTATNKTGIQASQAIGNDLIKLYPQLNEIMPIIEDSIKSGKINQQRKVSSKENISLYEDITIYPLKSELNKGAVIRIDDVTKNVKMQELLIQSEKMLSVGGLAAGIAHEINNPLTGMMQTATVIKKRLTQKEIHSNKEAAKKANTTIDVIFSFMKQRGIPEMLNELISSGNRVAEIIKNMLSFSRNSTLKQSAQKPDVLINQTIELAETDYNLKKHYDFKTIKILKDYQPNLPLIKCSKTQIQQVILNILKNGAQAMHGYRCVEGKDTDNPCCFIIRLKSIDPTMLHIEIEDNGPGIPASIIKNIFNPFYTTKEVGKGTGLGLFIAYFIITENHRGSIKVESEINKGTKFIISLPV